MKKIIAVVLMWAWGTAFAVPPPEQIVYYCKIVTNSVAQEIINLRDLGAPQQLIAEMMEKWGKHEQLDEEAMVRLVDIIYASDDSRYEKGLQDIITSCIKMNNKVYAENPSVSSN